MTDDPAPLGAGPEPPCAGAVQVHYAGWLVDDGHPVVTVGQSWTPRLELQRHADGSNADWFPLVEPDSGDGPTFLHALPNAPVPATYRFAGEVHTVGSAGLAGDWSAVEAGGVWFAVPGRRAGRIRGVGYLVHDTYMVEAAAVAAVIERPVRVERIQALRRLYDHPPCRTRDPDTAIPEPVTFLGYAPPVEVTHTAQPLQAFAGDHTFFIDVRPR